MYEEFQFENGVNGNVFLHWVRKSESDKLTWK